MQIPSDTFLETVTIASHDASCCNQVANVKIEIMQLELPCRV